MDKLEDRIQAECVTWYTNTYCLLHHTPRCMVLSIPNGGSRDVREAMTMKSTGLLPGASDLIVIHQTGRHVALLWMECKTETGRQSKDQVDFQHRIEALGYRYVVFRSLEQFRAIINELNIAVLSHPINPYSQGIHR